jgi:hypothetical protein
MRRASLIIQSQSLNNNYNNEDDASSGIRIQASSKMTLPDSINPVGTDMPTTEVETTVAAQTNTINTRLLAEIEVATRVEKGSKSSFSTVFQYNPSKTPEERELSIQQARDLNGINPTTTLLAGFVACVMGYGLWITTQWMGQVFGSHPISIDAPYLFTRIASVFRNIVMGVFSLASGFFSVTGVGIFLLGVRVTQGVLTGELDPQKGRNEKGGVGGGEEEMELPNIWELMSMTDKRKRRM